MSVSSKSARTREADPRRIKKGGAEAGIMSGEASGEGSASLVEIAIWNELGTSRIPPRPFIQSTADEKAREWKKTVKRVTKLMQDGKVNAEDASGLLGQQMQADIQQKIIDLRDPPNADSTKKKKKGSDNPLIDTGSLRDGVKYVGLS